MSEVLRVDLTSRIASRQRPFVADARRGLNASLPSGPTQEAQIEMARADALNGDLDRPRDSIRKSWPDNPPISKPLGSMLILKRILGTIPYPLRLDRRALAIEDSPALRAALNKIQP